MPYPPQSIANAFLELAAKEGKQLTNMQLQKLVFLAHAWHLGVKEVPLINTPVKAWNFGPVIPPLYNTLKKYGNGVVSSIPIRYDPVTGKPLNFQTSLIDSGAWAIINRVWKVYGNLTGGQLSTLTHKVNGPWDRTYRSAPFSEIPDNEIGNYYKSLKR